MTLTSWREASPNRLVAHLWQTLGLEFPFFRWFRSSHQGVRGSVLGSSAPVSADASSGVRSQVCCEPFLAALLSNSFSKHSKLFLCQARTSGLQQVPQARCHFIRLAAPLRGSGNLWLNWPNLAAQANSMELRKYHRPCLGSFLAVSVVAQLKARQRAWRCRQNRFASVGKIRCTASRLVMRPSAPMMWPMCDLSRALPPSGKPAQRRMKHHHGSMVSGSPRCFASVRRKTYCRGRVWQVSRFKLVRNISSAASTCIVAQVLTVIRRAAPGTKARTGPGMTEVLRLGPSVVTQVQSSPNL